MKTAVVIVLALLAPCAALAGEERNATLTRAVEIVSGKTGVDVSCEPDQAAWEREVIPLGGNAFTSGYAWIGGARARFAPWVCRSFSPGALGYGAALNVAAHEAAHLRGIRDEATASCWGLLWPADLARQLSGIEFYSTGSLVVIEESRAMHDRLFSTYRALCA